MLMHSDKMGYLSYSFPQDSGIYAEEKEEVVVDEEEEEGRGRKGRGGRSGVKL